MFIISLSDYRFLVFKHNLACLVADNRAQSSQSFKIYEISHSITSKYL